jgi:hypothetical protein
MTSEVAVGDVALVSGTFQIVKNRKILRMLTCLTVDDLFGSEFESELPTNDVGLVEAESVVANAAPLSVDLDFDQIGFASVCQTNSCNSIYPVTFVLLTLL